MRVAAAHKRVPKKLPLPKRMPSKPAVEKDLVEFAGKARPKKKRSAGPRSNVKNHAAAREAASATIEQYKATGNYAVWATAEARDLVGLYSLLHSKVYGVDPAELDGADYMGALSAARRAMKDLGGARTVFELVRWKWNQIERRLQSSDADNGFRMGWRIQFSQATIVDFRVSQAKRASSRR